MMDRVCDSITAHYSLRRSYSLDIVDWASTNTVVSFKRFLYPFGVFKTNEYAVIASTDYDTLKNDTNFLDFNGPLAVRIVTVDARVGDRSISYIMDISFNASSIDVPNPLVAFFDNTMIVHSNVDPENQRFFNVDIRTGRVVHEVDVPSSYAYFVHEQRQLYVYKRQHSGSRPLCLPVDWNN